MIDQDTIQRVKDAAKIEEVVGDYVRLTRRGANLVGLCPFHQEKTPSFNVNPARNICKCFGCGKGGDPVHFLMAVEGCGFIDAVKKLGAKYNIEVKDRYMSGEDRQKQDVRESLFAINAFAQQWFQDQMWNTDEGRAVARSYFLEKRQIREDVARKFALGYCPDSWDAFSKAAVEAGFKEEYLIKTGLCKRSERGTLYDFFRGRVIYPARTLSGKTVAFGGRIMTENKQVGKYFNSPESEIYEKNRELYGIYEAHQAIVNQKFAYLVEGYMDVISMHQAGVENVVASSGTSLTEQQVKLLRRFTQNVTVCYDGDAAGIHAAIRSINMLLSEGINIKLLLLPDGHDPDSFSHQMTSDEFQAYISGHKTDFIQYMAGQYMAEGASDPTRRTELINEVLGSIAVIPDVIARQVYLQDCSRLLGISMSMLELKLNEILTRNEQERQRQQNLAAMNVAVNAVDSQMTQGVQPAQRQSATYRPANSYGGRRAPSWQPQQPQWLLPKVVNTSIDDQIARQMLGLVGMMVRYGSCEAFHDEQTGESMTAGQYILQELDADGIRADDPVCRQLIDEYRDHQSDPDFAPDIYFSSHQDHQLAGLAQRLLTQKYKLSRIFSRQKVSEHITQDVHITTDEERLAELLPQLIYELKHNVIRKRIDGLLAKIEEASRRDDDSLPDMMLQLEQLKEIDKELAQALHRPIT